MAGACIISMVSLVLCLLLLSQHGVYQATQHCTLPCGGRAATSPLGMCVPWADVTVIDLPQGCAHAVECVVKFIRCHVRMRWTMPALLGGILGLVSLL